MNVIFDIKKTKLSELFVNMAEQNAMYGLKGHVARGGLRASLYNAVTIDSVHKLIQFMENFRKNYAE